MVPNCHPHVAILIVTTERLVGTVEDCLQRRLSKTNLIRQLNIKHGRCKRTIIYSHLTNRKVRDEYFTVVCFDTAVTHWSLISSGWSCIKNSIFPIVARTAFVSGYAALSSSSRAGPCSSSFSWSCSSVDLMTTQDVIFSLFMVSLLWFWLTQPTPVKTLIFLEENLRHMWPVLLNKRFFFFFSFFSAKSVCTT